MTWKEAREKANVTVPQIAEKLGITETAVYQKESKKRRFNLAEARIMCHEYKVTLDDIED